MSVLKRKDSEPFLCVKKVLLQTKDPTFRSGLYVLNV